MKGEGPFDLMGKAGKVVIWEIKKKSQFNRRDPESVCCENFLVEKCSVWFKVSEKLGESRQGYMGPRFTCVDRQ